MGYLFGQKGYKVSLELRLNNGHDVSYVSRAAGVYQLVEGMSLL